MTSDEKPVTETNYETGATPKAALPKTEAEWRKILTPDQYHVTREHGTERPGSSELLHVNEDGSYRCVGCGQLLFTSKTKYDHHCGWPSFTSPASEDAIGTQADYSFFMHRTEVHCSNCGAHLGHVFDDGPSPLGTRYCMNGVALKFESAKKKDDDANPGD